MWCSLCFNWVHCIKTGRGGSFENWMFLTILLLTVQIINSPWIYKWMDKEAYPHEEVLLSQTKVVFKIQWTTLMSIKIIIHIEKYRKKWVPRRWFCPYTILDKSKEIYSNWNNSNLLGGKDYKRIDRFGRLMDIFITLVAMVLWVQIHEMFRFLKGRFFFFFF